MKMFNVVYRGKVLEDYFLDENGEIYSAKRGWKRKLSVQPGDNYNPYPKVGVTVDGKVRTLNVHRLVCETFHKKPLPEILSKAEWSKVPCSIKSKLIEHIQHADRYQVNHIDHDRNNYHPSNLEWVTTSENQQKYQEYKRAA
jgi:exosome complex RNA-binding protein Csl4